MTVNQLCRELTYKEFLDWTFWFEQRQKQQEKGAEYSDPTVVDLDRVPKEAVDAMTKRAASD